MRIRGIISFIFLLSIFGTASAQLVYDSAETEAFQGDQEETVTGSPDQGSVEPRSFDEDQYRKLATDPELQYREPPTIGENFLQRLKRLLGELLSAIFEGATETSWGRVLLWVGGLGLVVVLIMLILKVDAFKVFYSGEGAAIRYDVLDENIHEIDFEKEIDSAVKGGDYRRGVRLLFLYALKTLSDKNHIQWQQGKTNHDYAAELKDEGLRPGFNELSYYFDYAWYGNFRVNRELFEKVNGLFSDWRGRVR